MKLLNLTKLLPLLMLVSSAYASTNGGVTIGGTRLIYDGNKKESSLSVKNSDKAPYLIQSWSELENGEKAPFVVTPPLFKLDGNQENRLRIVRTSSSMPEDRESLYWLNIKSIPASSDKDEKNTLQIAVKTRIKLIYRPGTIKGTAEDVTDKLQWSYDRDRITVKNPTPFIMNFKEVKIGGKLVKDASYVLPMNQSTFKTPAGSNGKITWKLISDFGGIGEEHTSK